MEEATPTAAMFHQLLGYDLSLRVDSSQTVPATLIEVNELPPATLRDDLFVRKDPFSMVFKIMEPLPNSQGMYALEHSEIGIVEMFFVQIGATEYEVIFN